MSTTFPSSQLQALFDLYNATNGLHWNYGNCPAEHWNFSVESVNPCVNNWCGIGCDNNLTTVTYLNLQSYNLQGTLPSTLIQLEDLLTLYLNDNSLHGTIPSSFINFTQLRVISLAYNKLEGTVPDIFSSESLLYSLDLSGNILNGEMPVSFQSLQHITSLSLIDNDLWGNLNKWLASPQLAKLQTLDIKYNLFSGSFPSKANLTNILTLDLEGNRFSGSMPDIFYSSTYMNYISCAYNQFTGSLPWSLVHSSTLADIIADVNNFDGSVDDIDWSVMKALGVLTLSDNYFTGFFPDSICSTSSIFFLALNFNFFSGSLSIEECQSNFYRTLNILTLQGNFFTGALQDIFDVTQYHRLFELSLSGNQLTGTIPGLIFSNFPNLSGFGVGVNCLSGTIPNEICTANNLLGISIDGASTAENCKIPLIDVPSLGLNAFVTRRAIHGTIPECIFSLRSIIAISLSGNQLTGTLPNANFVNFSSLVNVSVSYNRLTGTISPSWFGRKWTLLDLSQNKIHGLLPENSEIQLNQDERSIFSLEENRLSGGIPSVLNSFSGNLKLLNGNMFRCQLNKQDLPRTDPDYETYICGSNMVNVSIYLWLLFGIVFFALLGIYKIRKNYPRGMLYQRLKDFCSKVGRAIFIKNTTSLPNEVVDGSNYPSILNFFSFTLHVRQYAVLVLCFILLVLMPVYAVLGVYYRTYDERYAWTISAIFLSSTNATITLMVFFVLFIVFAVVVVHGLFRKAVREYYDRHVYCVRSWLRWRVVVLWTIAWLINGTIMITADSVYVYLIINRSTKYEYLIQITLALFKLAWHDIGIFRMIYWLKKWFKSGSTISEHQESLLDDGSGNFPMISQALIEKTLEDRELLNPTKESQITSTFFPTLLSTQDIRYLTYMSIINKVIIPCLAISFISSSCFYNALVTPEPQVSYIYVCYFQFSCINILGTTATDSTFTPAFNYSYQCSSAFLTDYVPVFVFMLLFSSIIIPALTVLMNEVSLLLHNKKSKGGERILKIIRSFLPDLKDVEDRRLRANDLILHRKQLLTLRISYTFAVMFVFGSLFPPLALIAVIGIMNITMLEEYLMKSLLEQCSSPSHSELNIESEESSLSHFPPSSSSSSCSFDYMEYLEEECKDIDRNWFKVKKLIVYLTCGLLGFVLFDVCGDRNGWREGMIPMVLMIVFPLVLFALIAFITKQRMAK